MHRYKITRWWWFLAHTLREKINSKKELCVECKICLSQTFKRFALYKYFSLALSMIFSAISLFALVSSSIFISLGGCLCVGEILQTVWQTMCVPLAIISQPNSINNFINYFQFPWASLMVTSPRKFRECLFHCQKWSFRSFIQIRMDVYSC